VLCSLVAGLMGLWPTSFLHFQSKKRAVQFKGLAIQFKSLEKEQLICVPTDACVLCSLLKKSGLVDYVPTSACALSSLLK